MRWLISCFQSGSTVGLIAGELNSPVSLLVAAGFRASPARFVRLAAGMAPCLERIENLERAMKSRRESRHRIATLFAGIRGPRVLLAAAASKASACTSICGVNQAP